MNIATIIQARMSSSRLPNKVLKSINGKPVIEYLIDQIYNKNRGMPIIIATSKDDSDREIRNYCMQHKIDFHAGDLFNVASRFYEIIQQYDLDFFVRVCADSPLLDGDLIKNALTHISEKVDMITNIMPRTFPKGQSVEVVKCDMFNSNYKKFQSKEDYEHVTRYFYHNKKSFNIINIKNNEDFSSINLAIDTKHDFERISRIIANFEKNHFDYTHKDLIKFYLNN